MPDAPKRHLMIFFKTGGVVKIEELPANFDFQLMIAQVRSAGFFNIGLLYVPHEVINGMAWVQSDQEVKWAPDDGIRTTLQ
jgi:hypothetical protein